MIVEILDIRVLGMERGFIMRRLIVQVDWPAMKVPNDLLDNLISEIWE